MRQLYRPIESSMKFDSLFVRENHQTLPATVHFHPSIDKSLENELFFASFFPLEGRKKEKKKKKILSLLIINFEKNTWNMYVEEEEGGRHAEFFESSSEDGGIVSKALGNGGRLSR